jgi:hypothetical protein
MLVKCKRSPVRSVSSSDDIQNGNVPQSSSKNVHLVAMKQRHVKSYERRPRYCSPRRDIMLPTRQTVQTFLLSEISQADKYLDVTIFWIFGSYCYV